MCMPDGMDPRPPIAQELKRAAILAKGRAMLRGFPMPQGIMKQGTAPIGTEVIECPPNAVEVEWLLS